MVFDGKKDVKILLMILWTRYPQMTEEQIALACPIFRGNCNCKACLRMEGRFKVWFSSVYLSEKFLFAVLFYLQNSWVDIFL